MKEFLTILVIIIGFMASTCVLFYPQETDRQKAVKIGCYLGDISAVIFIVEIIQKYFFIRREKVGTKNNPSKQITDISLHYCLNAWRFGLRCAV